MLHVHVDKPLDLRNYCETMRVLIPLHINCFVYSFSDDIDSDLIKREFGKYIL